MSFRDTSYEELIAAVKLRVAKWALLRKEFIGFKLDDFSLFGKHACYVVRERKGR